MLITDAAVREAAANLAQSLGDGWVIDTAAPADGAAHLVYSEGRGISSRPIFGGTTVQLWITGSAAPPLPDDATLADHALREAQLTARLPEGHRYNKATTLATEADEDPELIILLRTLEHDRLPAFDYRPRYVGHRPWIDLFDSALSQVMDEAPPATGTSLRDSGPEAHTTPPHVDIDAEPATDTEPGTVAERDPAIERDPSPAFDGDQHRDAPAADEAQEGDPSPAEEPDPEVTPAPNGEPGPNSVPEPKPANDNSGEVDDQTTDETSPTTKRRPRSRTPKRRPKASPTARG